MCRAMENRGFVHRAFPACRDRETCFNVISIGIIVTADFADGTDRERTYISQSLDRLPPPPIILANSCLSCLPY